MKRVKCSCHADSARMPSCGAGFGCVRPDGGCEVACDALVTLLNAAESDVSVLCRLEAVVMEDVNWFIHVCSPRRGGMCVRVCGGCL